MKKWLYISFLLAVTANGFAQQDPMYSMYMYNKMLLNPGYTGSSDYMVTTVKHRSQFVGMEGAPQTQALSFHTPIGGRFIGLGVKVVNDQIAIINNLNASLFYSYHLNLAGGKLSLGLETGIYNRRIDYSTLSVNDLGDNALPMGAVSSLVPDASWGIHYQREQMYVGFSQNHLIKAKFDDNVAGPYNSHLYTHTNFMLGNVFDINKQWSVEASTLMKSVSGAPVQFDFNGTVYYKDVVGAGIQYRTGDAIVGLLRVSIVEQLRLSYAYDMTISGLSTYSGGAHEIMLSYGVKLPPPRAEKEVHPRYYY